VHGRCYTRACYRFDDCGHRAYWASPSRWRDRVAPGDSIATVFFWLGEPNGRKGETYYWAYGKPGQMLFATTFRDGRFVEWQDDVSLQATKASEPATQEYRLKPQSTDPSAPPSRQ
jgi:hypothetical protein